MAGSRPGSSVLRHSAGQTTVFPRWETGSSPARLEPSDWSSSMIALALNLEAASEPAPGYRLVRLLGHGGSGVVWEAEAPGGIRVALKFIRTDSTSADRELRASR